MNILKFKDLIKEHNDKDILLITGTEIFDKVKNFLNNNLPKELNAMPEQFRTTVIDYKMENGRRIKIFKAPHYLVGSEDYPQHFENLFKGTRNVVVNMSFSNFDEQAFYISMHTCGSYYKATSLNRIFKVNKFEIENHNIDMKWVDSTPTVQYTNTPILFCYKDELAQDSASTLFTNFCYENDLDMFTEIDGCRTMNLESILLFSMYMVGSKDNVDKELTQLTEVMNFENVSSKDYQHFRRVAYNHWMETKTLGLSVDDSNQYVCKF